MKTMKWVILGLIIIALGVWLSGCTRKNKGQIMDGDGMMNSYRQITQEDDKSLLDVLSDEAACEYLTHNAVHDIAAIKRMIAGMQRFFDEKQRIRWGIAQKQDGQGAFQVHRLQEDCSGLSWYDY